MAQAKEKPSLCTPWNGQNTKLLKSVSRYKRKETSLRPKGRNEVLFRKLREVCVSVAQRRVEAINFRALKAWLWFLPTPPHPHPHPILTVLIWALFLFPRMELQLRSTDSGMSLKCGSKKSVPAVFSAMEEMLDPLNKLGRGIL